MEETAKILVLESDWRSAPHLLPTQRYSTAKCYASIGLQIQSVPLIVTAFKKTLEHFLSQPINKKGINVIILSGHAGFENQTLQMAAVDQLFEPLEIFESLQSKLLRSILILDACFLGLQLELFMRRFPLLGCIGFTKQVNWVSSSILVLILLRHFREMGVFEMRRKSAIRPRKILEQLQNNSTQHLVQQLGFNFLFSK
ncbi:MAG: hypothetical protein RIT27_2449 [Pseudomonadota bacterium]|jgi:hypothetical protein